MESDRTVLITDASTGIGLAEAERDWGRIDVLVNNAGVSYRAVVEHVAEEEGLLK